MLSSVCPDAHDSQEDLNNLTDLLRHCEADKPGPQPFYWALARLLHSPPGRRRPGQGTQKQVLLSTCLDREMERALAKAFPKFQLLIPFLYAQTPEDQEDTKWTLEWMLLECAQAHKSVSAIGYMAVERRLMTDVARNNATCLTDPANGPLLIKLFGSPLEELGWPEDTDKPTPDKQSIMHRLVLDETALVGSVSVSGLDWSDLNLIIAGGKLVFFGQDAVRWSDRMPYNLVDALPQKDSGSRLYAISFGTLGVLGTKALSRLQIRHFAPHSTHTNAVKQLVETIIKGAATQTQ